MNECNMWSGNLIRAWGKSMWKILPLCNTMQKSLTCKVSTCSGNLFDNLITAVKIFVSYNVKERVKIMHFIWATERYNKRNNRKFPTLFPNMSKLCKYISSTTFSNRLGKKEKEKHQERILLQSAISWIVKIFPLSFSSGCGAVAVLPDRS